MDGCLTNKVCPQRGRETVVALPSDRSLVKTTRTSGRAIEPIVPTRASDPEFGFRDRYRGRWGNPSVPAACQQPISLYRRARYHHRLRRKLATTQVRYVSLVRLVALGEICIPRCRATLLRLQIGCILETASDMEHLCR